MDKITQVLFSDIGKVTTQYVEVPHQELKPHEVRIAPVFYGICGSDLHVLKGGHPFAKPPVVPGHEIAARVTEVGSDVKNVQPGDHVVVDPIMACMECRACKAGRFNLCEPPQVAGFRAPGFARSQHIVPARNCHVAPASLPLKVLAFAEPAACARHCVNRMPKASLESVLVIGAGTIGLSIVQALRSRSAAKAEEELDSFFAHFALANIDSINMATTQLAISLSRTVHSMAAVHEGTRQLPNYRVVSGALAGCDTLEQRKAVLKEYCGRVIELRNSEAQAKKENQIDRIKEFIETNYTNPMLNTEDIAAYAELSPNYLRTVFKNATGKSPTDYLTDYRMERAMELLVTTSSSTKDIAAAVGYYNHRYFYSVFKAKTDMTATEYRKAQRADTAPKEGGEA